MKIFSIVLDIVIVLTLVFLVGKSIYIEHICSKTSKKTQFFVFSGIALINIGLIIIPIAYIFANNINVFSLDYIFVLIILILFVFQGIQSSRLVIFNHGLICMGQYVDFKKIKKVSIAKRSFGNIVLIELQNDSLNFRIGNNKTDDLSKIFKENRINTKIC